MAVAKPVKAQRLRARREYYVMKLSDAAALESFKACCSTAEKFKTLKPVSAFDGVFLIFREKGNSFWNNPSAMLLSVLAAT